MFKSKSRSLTRRSFLVEPFSSRLICSNLVRESSSSIIRQDASSEQELLLQHTPIAPHVPLGTVWQGLPGSSHGVEISFSRIQDSVCCVLMWQPIVGPQQIPGPMHLPTPLGPHSRHCLSGREFDLLPPFGQLEIKQAKLPPIHRARTNDRNKQVTILLTDIIAIVSKMIFSSQRFNLPTLPSPPNFPKSLSRLVLSALSVVNLFFFNNEEEIDVWGRT